MLISTFTLSFHTIFVQDDGEEGEISVVIKEETLKNNQERVDDANSEIDEMGEIYTLTI